MDKIDIFLIGVQKAGTSSLFNWIAQHPAICGPSLLKDYHYWISPKLNDIGWEFIEKQFKIKEKGQQTLLGGVNYIYHNSGADFIHNHNPQAKLILVLRNPVKRAVSAHKYFTKLGQENLNLELALNREKENQLRTYQEKSNWSYIAHGLYHEQIVRYLNYFDRSQIHVLFFEDMVLDNTSSIKGIFDFLNIDNSFTPEFIRVNETGKAKFQWLNNMLFGKKGIGKLVSFAALIFPFSWRIRFGNWIREVNKTSSRSETDNTSIIEEDLETLFYHDVKNLSELLSIDLIKKWGFTIRPEQSGKS